MNRKYIDFVPSSKARSGANRASSPRRRVVREVREENVTVVMPNKRRVAQAADVSPSKQRYNDLPDLPKDEVVLRNDLSERKIVSYGGSQNDSFSIETSLKMGVVEDYNPRFVNTNVPKRPLHNESLEYATIASVSRVGKKEQDDLAKVKAQKVKKSWFSRNKKTNKASAKVKTASQSPKVIPMSGDAKAVNTKTVGARTGSQNKNSKSSAATFMPPRSPFINQEKVVKRPLSSKNVYQKAAVSSKETAKGPVTIISTPEKDSKLGLLVTIILTIILGAVAGTVAFLLLPK